MSLRAEVSVIVPVYNAAEFLPQAIGSIREQCYPSLEVIVIDDGSTDHTREVVAALSRSGMEEAIRYVRQPNRGPAAARNHGLSLARGDIIAFLDADDLWPRSKLSVQGACIASEPRLEIVLGRTQAIGDVGKNGPPISVDGTPQVSVQLGSGLFRKSVFDRIGSFDETLRYSEDHDWFLRAREQGIAIKILDDVTLLYRRHAKSMTATGDAAGFQLLEVLKKSLDRRRRTNGDGGARPLPKLEDLDGAS